MDWFYLLAILTVLFYFTCLVLILIGDCDILLQIAEKFGKKPGINIICTDACNYMSGFFFVAEV